MGGGSNGKGRVGKISGNHVFSYVNMTKINDLTEKRDWNGIDRYTREFGDKLRNEYDNNKKVFKKDFLSFNEKLYNKLLDLEKKGYDGGEFNTIAGKRSGINLIRDDLNSMKKYWNGNLGALEDKLYRISVFTENYPNKELKKENFIISGYKTMIRKYRWEGNKI